MCNEELAEKTRNGDKAAAAALWHNCKPFVFSMAWSFCGAADREDLAQEGAAAILEAARKYDRETGTPFINYAAYWIHAAMYRYAVSSGNIVRIPGLVQRDRRKYKRFLDDFQKEHGRKPARREICQGMGIDREHLEEIERAEAVENRLSLDAPVSLSDDQGLVLADTIPGESDTEGEVIDTAFTEELRREVREQIGKLPGEELKILKLRIWDNLTFTEIGSRTGKTAAQARSMVYKALRDLRKGEAWEILQPYYDDEFSEAYRGSLESFNRTWTSATERVALHL